MIVSEDVIHDEAVIRDAASRALVAALGENRSYAEAILKQLLALYEEKLFVSNVVFSYKLSLVRFTEVFQTLLAFALPHYTVLVFLLSFSTFVVSQ